MAGDDTGHGVQRMIVAIPFGQQKSNSLFYPLRSIIQNQGVSTWQYMPYSDVNGCSLQAGPSQVANASAYKISSYVKIPNTDQVAIKTMVASRHPVITNIVADNSFVNAGPGFIWKSYLGRSILSF
jgi:Papain family cysteine protease